MENVEIIHIQYNIMKWIIIEVINYYLLIMRSLIDVHSSSKNNNNSLKIQLIGVDFFNSHIGMVYQYLFIKYFFL